MDILLYLKTWFFMLSIKMLNCHCNHIINVEKQQEEITTWVMTGIVGIYFYCPCTVDYHVPLILKVCFFPSHLFNLNKLPLGRFSHLKKAKENMKMMLWVLRFMVFLFLPSEISKHPSILSQASGIFDLGWTVLHLL